MKTFTDFIAAAKIEYAATVEKFDAEARQTLDEKFRLGTTAGPLICIACRDPKAEFDALPGQPFNWGKLNPTHDLHPVLPNKILTSNENTPYGSLTPEKTPSKFTKSDWCRANLTLTVGSTYLFEETLYDGALQSIRVLEANDHSASWPESLPKSPTPPAATRCAFDACLDASVPILAIKGPPGTGKTDLLAKVALALALEDRKVGIVTVSHDAVDNALRCIMALRGAHATLKVWKHANPDPAKTSGPLDPTVCKLSKKTDMPSIWGAVIASATHMYEWNGQTGITLNFKHGTCDVLLIDEAGQVPAYEAAALSRIAPRMILFGDEDQLPNICHGQHPPGSHGDSSAMRYLRDDLPPACLIPLEVSHRMNSDICGLIQRHFYPDIPGLTAGKNADSHLIEGTTRFPALIKDDFPHPHPRLSRSEKEAARVVEWVQRLLKMQAVVEGELARPMTPEDIAILTPFRAHASAIKSALAKARLPEIKRLGTVDKMQGQGAAAVIYSLASSSKDYIAGQTEWLLSSNRWNVALSRAMACAIVVGDINAHLSAVPKALDGIAAQAKIHDLLKDSAWHVEAGTPATTATTSAPNPAKGTLSPISSHPVPIPMPHAGKTTIKLDRVTRFQINYVVESQTIYLSSRTSLSNGSLREDGSIALPAEHWSDFVRALQIPAGTSVENRTLGPFEIHQTESGVEIQIVIQKPSTAKPAAGIQFSKGEVDFLSRTLTE